MNMRIWRDILCAARSWRRRAAEMMIAVMLGLYMVPAVPISAQAAVDSENAVRREETVDGGIATPGDGEKAEQEEIVPEEDEAAMDGGIATPGNGEKPEAVSGGEAATPGNAAALPAAASLARGAVGDLWEDWNGDFDCSGAGTEDEPYRIETLAQLMGLSEAAAAGESFADTYFELTRDITLDFDANGGNWNPIGWYQNRTEARRKVTRPFCGFFDGGGHTISGLRIIDASDTLSHLGLFGTIDGGGVRNLKLEAEEVCGADCVGLLAGEICGDTVIYGVTVSGYVHASQGDAGGIAAVIDGGTAKATVENCRADGIAMNALAAESCAGGIVGRSRQAYLIDSEVRTYDGDADRIQGKGFVGGIAGSMERTDLYNSYVDGTVGGNASAAAGGIVGRYRSGDIILARMAGTVARTNMGTAKREGIFIGTRAAGSGFTYGTDRNDNLSYLFAAPRHAGKAACGTNTDGDNTWTKDAHVGYWTDNEKKYVVTAGRTEAPCGERYFYEELEDGVRFIVTQKLSRELAADSYADGLTFHIDHFAPGYMGEPVRGYLVSVEQVDAVNANGTIDTDVAVLTALPAVNSSYYRTISRDHAAAVMPGATVRVLTAPKNAGENRYQMISDGTQPGGVRPPCYTDEEGGSVSMSYEGTGAYTFVMPEADTRLSAQYSRATTQLTMSPAEMTLRVEQTRSGDRKNPQVVTVVYDDAGRQIAKYIGDQVAVTPTAVSIHAEHNGVGSAGDRTVRWSVDDHDLLTLTGAGTAGYTEKDAYILPNLSSEFIRGIISRKEKEQADSGYAEAIDDTVYRRTAVVSAITNPETSVNREPVEAHTRVNVTFRIRDYTTRRVEGLRLNHADITLTVVRRLTGSRSNPAETVTCSQPVVLAAEAVPAQPWLKNVSWKDAGGGALVELSAFGVNGENCKVGVRFDADGKSNPAWIQNVINADNEKRKQDAWARLEGRAVVKEQVTATSEDRTHGVITAVCNVTIVFETVDERVGYRPSGGGDGSSGGGSSSGSSVSGGPAGSGASGSPAGMTALGKSGAAPGLPPYVVSGTWLQNDAGRWRFADQQRTYANEWAAVHNPYADPARGQSTFDWFRFDVEGFLMTGWYRDADGRLYYLHPLADGTQGRMYTGWHQIDGRDYYFHEVSDGTRGALEEEKKPDTLTGDADGKDAGSGGAP